MKRPALVVAAVTAIVLLAHPFVPWHWGLAADWRHLVLWPVTAAFVFMAVGAARESHAAWCGIFGACAVAFNPVWPLEMPASQAAARAIGGGVLAAVYVIRFWR